MSGRSQHLLSFHPWRSVRFTFTLKNPSCLDRSVAIPDPLVRVNWCEPWLLPWSELPPGRGRSTWSILRKLWSALSSTISFSPTNIMRPSIPWLVSVIPCSSIPQLHLRIILFYALHPLFNVACCSRGLVGRLFPSRTSWSLGFHALFHHCICNGLVTLLHHIDCHLYLSLSPGSNNWACHAECNIPYFSVREPNFESLSPKEKHCFPRGKDHGFGNSFF